MACSGVAVKEEPQLFPTGSAEPAVKTEESERQKKRKKRRKAEDGLSDGDQPSSTGKGFPATAAPVAVKAEVKEEAKHGIVGAGSAKRSMLDARMRVKAEQGTMEQAQHRDAAKPPVGGIQVALSNGHAQHQQNIGDGQKKTKKKSRS